jgi:uncharacterized protein (TIGR03437 family)
MRYSAHVKMMYRLLAAPFLLAAAAFPQSISIVSGDGQLVKSLFPIASPLVVVVRDSAGNPIANATVSWAVTSGAGTGGVNTLQSTTDSNGQTSDVFIAPPIFNGASFIASTVNAKYGASSVNFTITSAAVSNGVIEVSPTVISPTLAQLPLQGAAGQQGSVPIKIQVTAIGGTQSGQGVPRVLLMVAPQVAGAGSTAACAGGNPYTDAAGIATCNVVFGGKLGSGLLSANIGNFGTYTFTYQVLVGPPSTITAVTGDRQSGNPGQTLPVPLVAQITDIGGNPIGGLTLVFAAVVPGTVTFSNVSATSDTRGLVSANVTFAANAGGPVQVRVSTKDGTVSTLFNLTANVIIGSLQVISGNQQSAAVSTAFASPLVVQVNDKNGNPLNGEPVTFAVTQGSATLSTANATTNAQGQASVTVTAGNTAGAIVVTATSGPTSQQFNLTAVPPGPSCTPGSTFYNGASFRLNQISPGGVATIVCTGIAPGIQGAVMPNLFGGPLPYQIAGVSVMFGSTPAPIYDVVNYNGAQSVTVEVPLEAQVGTEAVTVTANGANTVVNATVSQAAPGIFETGNVGPDGLRMAVVVRPDGSVVGPNNAIARGEIGRAYVTGLVPPAGLATDGLSPIDSDIEITTPVIVGVNNAGVHVPSVTYARNLVGVWEVQFQVPANTTPGARVPFVVAVPVSGKLVFSQGSTIPVQ